MKTNENILWLETKTEIYTEPERDGDIGAWVIVGIEVVLDHYMLYLRSACACPSG